MEKKTLLETTSQLRTDSLLVSPCKFVIQGIQGLSGCVVLVPVNIAPVAVSPLKPKACAFQPKLSAPDCFHPKRTGRSRKRPKRAGRIKDLFKMYWFRSFQQQLNHLSASSKTTFVEK